MARPVVPNRLFIGIAWSLLIETSVGGAIFTAWRVLH